MPLIGMFYPVAGYFWTLRDPAKTKIIQSLEKLGR